MRSKGKCARKQRSGPHLTYCRENRVLSVTGNSVTTTYVNELYECEWTFCVKYLFANGRRIAMQQVSTGAVSYFHPDHLGSTSVVTAGNSGPTPGNQEQLVTYYPYGATRTNTGSANVPYQYTD